MSTKPRRIEPRRWEKFQGFRETFLMYFTDPRASASLRGTAALLYDLVLEYYRHWSPWPGSTTATEMRAALADLRFLQDYFETVGKEGEDASLDERDLLLSKLAAVKAKELAGLEMRLRRRWGRVGNPGSAGILPGQVTPRPLAPGSFVVVSLARPEAIAPSAADFDSDGTCLGGLLL